MKMILGEGQLPKKRVTVATKDDDDENAICLMLERERRERKAREKGERKGLMKTFFCGENAKNKVILRKFATTEPHSLRHRLLFDNETKT